ncbi:MAG: TetR/AcrR family transcriptional regulator [Lachnospiraceae bacterium]|nr:TetR/AcrR family transcriptional regulator [Lachnospiraceae bacterium]
MARKEQITKQIILDGAFSLLREQGMEMVTARKLAAHIGCSTQPIFRVYKNMEELNAELFEKAKAFYEDYCVRFEKGNVIPFVDLGLCYIQFAKEELNLFRLLFLSPHDDENTMYDLINGKEHAFVIQEIKKIPNLNMNNAGDIFMKIFIFMHGMACMATNGEFDLSREEVVPMLEEAVTKFSRE